MNDFDQKGAQNPSDDHEASRVEQEKRSRANPIDFVRSVSLFSGHGGALDAFASALRLGQARTEQNTVAVFRHTGQALRVKTILFVGDIVGRPGRRFLAERLASLRKAHGIDFVVVNAENAAGGAGINRRIAEELHSIGVDAITLGDHVWDQKSFAGEIEEVDHVCRPANLPETCPGQDCLIMEKEGFRLGVFTVLGRVFMPPASTCPFLAAERVVEALRDQTDAVFVEVHAEATSEKIALGWHLDGRVAAVVGTHTHVPTADAAILPRGTAYVTDAGMTGPYRSVLGREIAPVVARFMDGMPRRFDVAAGDDRISGVLIAVEETTGLAAKIEPVTVRRSG